MLARSLLKKGNKIRKRWGPNVAFKPQLRFLCMLLVGVTLLVVWITQVSFDALWSVIVSTKPQFLVFAAMSSLFVSIVRTVRYGLFFPPHGRWMQLFGAFLAMRLVNTVMPFRSGELASIALLKKSDLAPDIAQVIPSWLLIRVSDVAAVTLWLTMALFFSELGGQLNSVLGAILVVPLVTIAAFAVLAVWVLRNSRNSAQGWLAERLGQLKLGFARTSNVVAWLRTFMLSLIVWGMLVGVVTFAQLASHTPLDVPLCFLVSTVVAATSMLPIHAPLGIGTGETVFVVVMALLGVSTEVAIPVALATRLVLLSLMMLDGTAGFLLLFFTKTPPGRHCFNEKHGNE